jgi:hypothetical protein
VYLDVAANVKGLGLSLDERGVLLSPVTLKFSAGHSLATAEGEH